MGIRVAGAQPLEPVRSAGFKVQGRATLSVEVHVACFSKSVDMEVDRSYGSHGGDPTIGDVLNEATWQDYAAAFAPTNASAA